MSTTWEYADARGVIHRGQVTRTHDFGGTDVSLEMTATCGTFSMLSGARLRDARVVTDSAECPHPVPAGSRPLTTVPDYVTLVYRPVAGVVGQPEERKVCLIATGARQEPTTAEEFVDAVLRGCDEDREDAIEIRDPGGNVLWSDEGEERAFQSVVINPTRW